MRKSVYFAASCSSAADGTRCFVSSCPSLLSAMQDRPNGGAASQSMEPLTPTAHRQRARLRTSFVVQRNSSTRQLVLLDAQHLKSYWLAEGTCVRKSDQSVGRSNMLAGASSRKYSASRAAGQWRAHRMASLWPILDDGFRAFDKNKIKP